MKLTTYTDFGLRTLMYLATLPEGELSSVAHVAKLYDVSRNHLVKVVNQLAREGYIKAIRGKNGGIRLGRPASEIRIGDVVRELEPLTLVNCSQSFCHITPACRLKPVLQRATEAFLAELDKCTLADLIEHNSPLYKLLLV